MTFSIDIANVLAVSVCVVQFVIISPASSDMHALLLSDDVDYYYYNLHISTDHLYFAGATNTHILDTALRACMHA